MFSGVAYISYVRQVLCFLTDHTEKERERQTDRQTDRDRETDTDRDKETETDRQNKLSQNQYPTSSSPCIFTRLSVT